jgi:hypothetical protein
MRNQKPYERPFQSVGEESFQNGWKFRLVFSSPESGFLYLLDESPVPIVSRDRVTKTVDDRDVHRNDRTNNELSILYPESSIGPTQIQPNQTKQTDWYVFDQNSGTEKLWVIWSANIVPELERARRFLNPKDRGLISVAADARAARDFLATHSASKPEIQRDTENRRLIAKANGDVLTSALELAHH